MDLNFKVFGEGKPVIILHGLFGMLDNWQTVAKKLADEYMVYIVDQRNHGRSPHLPDFNYTLMAEDLQIFMESQWIYEAIIVGHSMGGKTAMRFALDYPEMVEKLVVVDIGPKQYPAGHDLIFESLLSVDLSTVKSRQEVATILSKKIPDQGVVQFLMKNLSRTKQDTYEWKMNLPAIFKNYSNILAPLSVKQVFESEALFIRGEKSPYIQDKDWPSIHNVFPKASLITIPGAGHWVHAEQPQLLFNALSEFIQ